MKTIIWKGILYQSLEYFQLSESNDSLYVHSRIIGAFRDKFYLVDYSMNIMKNWTLKSFNIEFEVNNNIKKITGEKKDIDWVINGAVNSQFINIEFIDISLTPFTNTLPIKHLHLTDNQEQVIEVMYLDIFKGSIEPVKQFYRKNFDTSYHYENIPNDFEADIDTDEFGLVNFYPALFERITKQENSS